MLFTGKLNKLRTLAWLVIFIGIAVMYVGFLFRSSMIVMALFMVLGFLIVLSSMAIYFWAGVLSLRAVQVVCPKCEKVTRLLGKTDQCMFCGQWLSIDPKYKKDGQ
ncbi:MAG: DUF2614 family zinc ribbon-containing protein [Bacillota bacterium]|jgi:Protein of unknown function (DUF2614).